MTAYIGYDNAFDQSGVTITASGAALASGFPVTNAYDYRLHTSVKTGATGLLIIHVDAGVGNTISANYLAIAGHNLVTQGVTAKLQYSDNDSTWTDHITGVGNTGASFGYDATVEAHRYWRIRVASSAAGTYISQAMFGQALQCRPIGQGFTPSVYQHYKAQSAINRDGQYIGNVVKPVPMALKIKQRGINPADFRTDWVPFLEHARSKPFFFCWDYENYPEEAVYCWTDKPQQPVYESLCTMSIDLSTKAVRE